MNTYGPVIICRPEGGGGFWESHDFQENRDNEQALRGDQERKGKNYLKRWDQFVIFSMTLFRHGLI